MKKAILKRLQDNGQQTLGEFTFEGEGELIKLYSMELP